MPTHLIRKTMLTALLLLQAICVFSQVQNEPAVYKLLHRIEQRSDGGFAVLFSVTNLSSNKMGLFPIEYSVHRVSNDGDSADGQPLNPTPQVGPHFGSFGLIPLAAGETKELREEFYGAPNGGIGVFVVDRPAIYEIKARQILGQGKKGPWSNELVVASGTDGVWHVVGADPRED